MKGYSIRNLERLSGIKAHTLRIWEKRYHLLTPERTTTNIRHYSDDDLKKLLNTVVLLEDGLKISEISRLSDMEISKTIIRMFNDTRTMKAGYEVFIAALINAGLTYNERQFDQQVDLAFKRFGVRSTFVKIIFPFLKRVGLYWGLNEIGVAQEHFVSNLIIKKLFVAIDNLGVVPTGKDNYLLFLHEEEDHEIGLLLANYIAREAGKKVIYLGARLPAADLKMAINGCRPTHLMTFFITPQTTSFLRKYLKQLTGMAPGCSILLSGNSALVKDIKLPASSVWIDLIETFEQLVSKKKITA